MKNELLMEESEVEVFLALVKIEKSTSKEIENFTNKSKDEIIEIAKRLESKGMVIEVNRNEFRALHPRFAVVNRYRKLCASKNIEFKKNLKIDQLAVIIEKYQNSV
ncbi:helix-turn-helix domain-containing protein [Candidatus Nitrosocosmicus sp. FF01]|uniref:helix-turn-helix domain-containing protein n=1 Tax=Candidatus Nitrosocosmicus sp. FF01 TaxID=3397670 RepID=UPI0039E8C403